MEEAIQRKMIIISFLERELEKQKEELMVFIRIRGIAPAAAAAATVPAAVQPPALQPLPPPQAEKVMPPLSEDWTGDNEAGDECANGTDNCHDNATCTDTDDSFTCTCNIGYAGTGTSCADVNECTDGSDNCDSNAICANTEGSFTCTCKDGYTGNGTSCADKDECIDGTNDCDTNASGNNTAGSFNFTSSSDVGSGVSTAAMETNCSVHFEIHKCNITLLTELNTTFCYINDNGNVITASVQCSADSQNYTFNCSKTGSSSNGIWEPPLSCPPVTTTTILTQTTIITTTTAQTTRSATTTSSSQSLSTTNNEESTTSDSKEMPPQSTIPSSTGMNESTTSAFTGTHTTETTNTKANTSLSTRKSSATSQNSGTVVIATVSVFVVVVIALAAVIVFLLWRHKRLIQQNTMGGNSGTSISNRRSEDEQGLDRHISLLDMRPDASVDSGYAEISPGNLNVEESPSNVYQTIDNLPEDKTECGNGYGHLRMQTTTFIDNNYSHVPVDQNRKPSSDVTYAHTGNPVNVQELNDDEENETTYNHLEKNARKTQGIQPPLKNEEKEVVEDVDAVYNHAKAGHLTLELDNKGDTYSHLNQLWQRPQAYQQNESKFLTQGSKPQTYRNNPQTLDFDNDVGRNTFPEYGKCAKKLNEKQTTKQIGNDGYETPAGAANIYLTLEPETKIADTDVLFEITNETFEESESEEFPYHHYFTLEKTITDTDT